MADANAKRGYHRGKLGGVQCAGYVTIWLPNVGFHPRKVEGVTRRSGERGDQFGATNSGWRAELPVDTIIREHSDRRTILTRGSSLMEPLYTAENCKFSYPLQWGLTVFWLQEQDNSVWLKTLAESLEPDGIRVLSHRWFDAVTSQFAISTQPQVPPSKIVQRVKGRLQYLVRNAQPKPFQRNFAIRSFGSQERSVIERYVSEQTSNHSHVDERLQEFLVSLQIQDSTIDLSQASKTSHGLYWHNLHVVLVHRERWEASRSHLIGVRDMVSRVGQTKGWRISRAGLLLDHIHIALGCGFDDSPQDVALCFLNNLAFVYGMKAIFQFGAFIGTFGEYDNRVVDGELASD